MKKLEFNNSWNVALIKDWIIEIAYYQTSIVSVLHLKAFSDASDTKYVCIYCNNVYLFICGYS